MMSFLKIAPYRMDGRITAPPSKSMAQRALALAALADGPSHLAHCGLSEDVLAAKRCAVALGATVDGGADWAITPKPLATVESPMLDVGESGLSLRMFAFIASAMGRPVTLSGHGTLVQRPLTPLTDALRAAGVPYSTAGDGLPLRILGPVSEKAILLDGSATSQALTGLLMACPLLPHDTEISVSKLSSRPYVGMTLELMQAFGAEAHNDGFSVFQIPGRQRYRGVRMRIEGDWSAASNLLVAGALSGRVTVKGLSADSTQADCAILDALGAFGASVRWEAGSLTVEASARRPFIFDATDCPDLFPPLSVLAAGAEGTSTIHGTHRLRHKESDRLTGLAELIQSLGGKAESDGEALKISGIGKLKGGIAHSRGDHRMAMAAAVAACISSGPVLLSGAEAVRKSYPDFFERLEACAVR